MYPDSIDEDRVGEYPAETKMMNKSAPTSIKKAC